MKEAPITTVDIRKYGRNNFWEVSLKEMCIPVFILSFPVGWNADVMAGALAAKLDQEIKTEGA